MRPSGAAAVSVGLWVLVTVNVVADPAGTGPRRCSLSHYRWLDPRALEAVKALRDHYVSDAQTPVQGTPVLPGLRLVARGLSDAQAVLSSLPSPELFPGVAPTLELLASATRDVVACVSVPGARPLHPRRPALRSPAPQLGPRFSVSRGAPTRPDTIRVPLVSAGLGWEARGLGWWEMGPFASSVYLLCPLQLELARPGSSRKALRAPRRRPQRRRADSPGCHEATIIFNLVRLLTWDLKLAARSGPCL
ncbi:hypothetical protein QTO34_010406 [Cnephaeus nilssonii]|uniref:Uncharacterized protein n=1 Tax=Cnephaeus nilssonii TaxID=3371016 RepID=A0AA40HFA7_CNENI|nr:hypothetical protein QTO34_010406 [Eptesicus nilssonii]